MSYRIHTATSRNVLVTLLVEGGTSVAEHLNDDEMADVPLPALVFEDQGNLEAFVITVGDEPTRRPESIRTPIQTLAELLWRPVNSLVVENGGGLDDLFAAG